MDRATRDSVRRRAGDRCEYCRLPQEAEPLFALHVEHIVARQHLGSDEDNNLALACHHCNVHKGPNLAGLDRETSTMVPLFHPRRDDWHEHFRYEGGILVGLTPVGRATIHVLQINARDRVELREEWLCDHSME